MKNALLLWTVIVVAVSCTSLGPRTGRGLATVTTAVAVPDGILQARLAAVDGEPLRRGTHRVSLAAGSHRISVWPVDDRPWRDDESVYAIAIDFDVRAGAEYRFATRVQRYRTAAHSSNGTLLEQSVWQTVFVPVLVNSTDPMLAQTSVALVD